MDPEKPPRRKKSGEPVTIDLQAASTAGADAPPPQTDAPEPLADPAAEPAARPIPSPDDQPGTDRTAPQSPVEPAAAEPIAETPAEPAFTPQAEVPHPREEPSRSGAFAAAILGGLVALAGAGALQYGGYLPALGPTRTGSDDLAALGAAVEALDARLIRIETAPAAQASDLQPIEARLAAVEKVTGELATNGPAATGESQQSIAALEETVAKLTTDVAALRDQTSAAARAAADQSARLTERLDAAERKLEEPRSDVAMAKAVASSALKTAIDRGGPYLAELEAFASIAPEDPSIAPLRAHAATGVPSRADLVRAFQPVADAMIEASHRPAGDQGIVDRLLSSAASLVTVRPVGSVEGDTPEAIVARIENKLQNGDLKGAQIEWQTLPEPAQKAGADFKTKLDERIAVEDAVGALVSGAITSNGGQG
ncbi:COG4223 family protein [Mycoplana dimorpha]|uniref:Inner membrane protein n=1 Tax=Mycoplana dimorpha TaxID=28320 RepID=A0A2T5BBQ6_MYCDI|nr:mitofilin family membrane protein [Mycoplana dimorpha]PTM96394.1 hypothetical protein C7449_103412 [Mycoplana dimorpha]